MLCVFIYFLIETNKQIFIIMAKKKSDKPKKKSIVIRIHPDLAADIEEWAASEFRSVNGQIEYLLTRAVQKRKGKED